MTIGRVLGSVELRQGSAGAQQLKWAQVRCGSVCLTALDMVGAKKGELVLVAAGECAARSCLEVPVDAVIVGIVAENGNSG